MDPPASAPDLQLLGQAFAASVSSIAISNARQPDLPIIYVNPAFEQLSGYPAAEVIGRNCRFLQAGDRDQDARREIHAALTQGQSTTTVLRNYRKDGTLFYNELTLSPIRDAAGTITHFVGFQTDVTVRERTSNLMTRLQGMTQDLAAVVTQAEVFSLILRDALEALGGISGAVLLAQDDRLHVAARRGHDEASVWQDSTLGDSRPGTDALRSNTPLFFNASGDMVRAYPELERHTGGVAAVASAVLPMVEAGQPLGVIVLDFREPHHFTADEERFLLTLAGQCALALDRARLAGNLGQQVEDRTTELEAFVRFTELADGETDVLALAARAEEVLSLLFPDCTNGYYTLEDGAWKLKVYSSDLESNPALLALLKAGLPLNTPMFIQPMQTGEPAFVDAWDPAREQIAMTEVYQRVATYPLHVDGTVRAIFALGLKNTPRWTPHHKAVFRSVGRSLKLALERTETARQLAAQNAELQARTRALEGFAELTRDLGMNSDPDLLIRRALNLVLSLLPPGYAAFWQVIGEQWHVTAQVGEVGKPELQDAMTAGLPVGLTPSLDWSYQTREPLFQDHYDPARDIDPALVSHLLTVATLPVIVNGSVLGVFNVPLFGQRQWSAADRAVLISTAQSLGLALERAGQARQLVAQRDQLQASNEELEAFTYSVSHDLRTPVRHILSFGGLLRRSLPGPLGEKSERYFKIIETAAAHLNELIDGILDLSRTSRQPLEVSRMDLGRLVDAVRKELSVAAPDRQITWQVAELPTVVGDANLLRRVMMTLLSNAVKYTRSCERAVIEIWAEDQPQAWTIWVRDNGVGFDPQYQGKLFSMFQRLHRQEEFEGAAVGLANVRRIVTRHGGTVLAEGRPGLGATFGFTLPKGAEDWAESSHAGH
ncbi:PAS domain-containing protein [Deinococcus detaillensis]|uniref:histidine kinase n=1 Tax=Deinococcus detaillensis TaxID=2592048 RepID=A0A553UGR3_9DEIO|nr:GAF domain-containing protein [Deinococcus detaillensis]TSA79410.1 PAS domain-containing protein [Deinococcus detaillensis]